MLDSIPANPADVESISSILTALYDVISGPAQTRNWDRMRTLFAFEARLSPTGKRMDGTYDNRVFNMEQYIINAKPYFEKVGFFEKEISRKTDQYGSVVQVFSTYESRHKATDTSPFTRGINSIQLWNDGKRWWILSIFWQGETADNPIPKSTFNKIIE
jgi:hypothetical protein